jgi:hypothetical protein
MTGSNRSAAVATAIGLLAVAAVPAAAVASRFLSGITLLSSLYVGVPLAVGLAVLALLIARRARNLAARSVFQHGRRLTRLSRWLAWTGLYLGCTGALALAVYGALRWAQ